MRDRHTIHLATGHRYEFGPWWWRWWLCTTTAGRAHSTAFGEPCVLYAPAPSPPPPPPAPSDPDAL